MVSMPLSFRASITRWKPSVSSGSGTTPNANREYIAAVEPAAAGWANEGAEAASAAITLSAAFSDGLAENLFAKKFMVGPPGVSDVFASIEIGKWS